ncbi:MAG: hypothetical protein K2J91_05805 [Lachnospiraceae bacterium]|nr:hypothetical protein [Lachnospiraceae bacterium]
MIDELIKEMEQHIDCDDFEEIQEKCVSKIRESNPGIDVVESLLLFLESHPLSDFGIPGAIVHYVEQFYKNGYEDLLIASVVRRPTLHTVWMMNRIKNAGENSEKYEKLLNDILTKQGVEEEIKNSVKEFLDK